MSPAARRLTAASRARLEGTNLPTDSLAPLLDAGVPEDIAVTVAIARRASGWSTRPLRFDAIVYTAHPDPDLLIRVVNADLDTEQIVDWDTGTCLLTRSDLDTCLAHDISADVARDWLHTGRPLRDLSDAAARHPDWDRAAIAGAIHHGVTTSDLDWLAAHGLTLVFSSLGTLTGNTGTGQLATIPTEQGRRLALVLLVVHAYPMSAARALAHALASAPSVDLITRLVIDGTEPADAIDLARADDTLERRLTITTRTATAGAEPATPAR